MGYARNREPYVGAKVRIADKYLAEYGKTGIVEAISFRGNVTVRLKGSKEAKTFRGWVVEVV